MSNTAPPATDPSNRRSLIVGLALLIAAVGLVTLLVTQAIKSDDPTIVTQKDIARRLEELGVSVSGEGLSDERSWKLPFGQDTGPVVVHSIFYDGNDVAPAQPGIAAVREAIELIQQLPDLDWMSLDNLGLEDNDIVPIAELKNVGWLSLSGNHLTGASLVHLRSFARLEKCSLDENRLAAGSLIHLAALTSLERLSLFGNVGLSDSDLADITSLTKLWSLDLSGIPITDDGMAHLGALVNLQYLYLDGTNVTGSGFKELQQLQQLRSLDLSRTPIRDEHLQALQNLKSLDILILDNTDLSDDGLRHIAAIRNLAQLSIKGCNNVTPKGLNGLRELSTLDWVGVDQQWVDKYGEEAVEDILPPDVLDVE